MGWLTYLMRETKSVRPCEINTFNNDVPHFYTFFCLLLEKIKMGFWKPNLKKEYLHKFTFIVLFSVIFCTLIFFRKKIICQLRNDTRHNFVGFNRIVCPVICPKSKYKPYFGVDIFIFICSYILCLYSVCIFCVYIFCSCICSYMSYSKKFLQQYSH